MRCSREVRRPLLLAAVVAALAVPAAASARSTGKVPFTIHAKTVKGKVTVYAFTVTAKLPSGFSVSGFVPGVSGTAKGLAKGTTIASVVGPAGPGSWKVYVLIDAKTATGSSGTLSGSVDLSGPLEPFPATDSEPLHINCLTVKNVLDDQARTNGESAAVGWAVWVLLGATYAGKQVVIDAKTVCQ